MIKFIVAHDIGGAQALKRLIELERMHDYLFYVLGPAKSVFDSSLQISEQEFYKLVKIKNIDTEVIISTGWNTFEISVMKYLSEKDIPYSACLDNWIYYKERFYCPSSRRYYYPKSVYVLDEIAYSSACNTFPDSIEIILVHQSVTEIVYPNRSKRKNKSLVYISQPLSETESLASIRKSLFVVKGISQHEAYLNCHRSFVTKQKITSVYICPHPAESIENVDRWLRICENHENISISNYKECVEHCTIAIGFNSSLLVDCLKRGLKVFSLCKRYGWNNASLPHHGILDL